MLSLFKRDHFILGYAANGILYIKNGKSISFDDLKRLGYDCTKAIDRHNNLLHQIDKVKVTHFMPLRKNLWRSPLFTVVSDSPLDAEEVDHLYRFCQLLGGIKTTVSYVSSVPAFIEKPTIKLVLKNYTYSSLDCYRNWKRDGGNLFMRNFPPFAFFIRKV